MTSWPLDGQKVAMGHELVSKSRPSYSLISTAVNGGGTRGRNGKRVSDAQLSLSEQRSQRHSPWWLTHECVANEAHCRGGGRVRV